MKEFPSEIIEIIAVGDTIIFNFPLSIFNSAAEWLPYKLKFDRKTCSVLPLFSVPLGQEDCREDDAEAHEHPGRDGFAVDYH